MRTTAVSKCLDRKLVIFGFEVLDILAIFLVLSTLNLLFGQSPMKPLLVWAPSLILAAVLRWGKRGKPDKYLVHWIRYQIKPGAFSAFSERPHVRACPRIRAKHFEEK